MRDRIEEVLDTSNLNMEPSRSNKSVLLQTMEAIEKYAQRLTTNWIKS